MIKKNKKAAISMSIGTIITMVLMISFLILGLILVRNLMCSGIVLSDQISEKMTNEVQGLFGANEYGVKCMGEGGQEVTLADGGTRQIGCVISTDTPGDYDIKVTSVESKIGVTQAQVDNWILDQDFTGSVSVGSRTVPVLVLNIPKKAQATTLKITIDVTYPDQTVDTLSSFISIKPISGFTSAVC
jgi:hypothetical protein